MNIDEIISAIEYNHGKFPRHALERAMEEKELITPRLLQVIRNTTDDIQTVDDDSAYILHIYALYLLAQFRETDAYLPIIEFFSTSDVIAQHITGDVVTESLGSILASTFNGDVSPLEKLIENKDINEYTRSAALQALCILWSCEKISRQQIIEYYRYLFSEVLVGEISYVWTALVANSLKLSPDELKEETAIPGQLPS